MKKALKYARDLLAQRQPHMPKDQHQRLTDMVNQAQQANDWRRLARAIDYLRAAPASAEEAAIMRRQWAEFDRRWENLKAIERKIKRQKN